MTKLYVSKIAMNKLYLMMFIPKKIPTYLPTYLIIIMLVLSLIWTKSLEIKHVNHLFTWIVLFHYLQAGAIVKTKLIARILLDVIQ